MNKKYFLLCGAAALLTGSAQGQKLDERYITWPAGESLASYVSQWNGGSGTIKIDGTAWEDEEFFTSRVKPREAFINRSTQVYSTINDDNDKRYCNWVPIGNALNGEYASNALPNGNFDQEVFSMWSYVDNFQNWTAPFGWNPGAFSDVCHKNGVASGGVAGVPYGGISTGWSSAFSSLVSSYRNNTDALGKFLYYHGVDGLGYNSEWSGYAPNNGLITIHNNLKTYMSSRNPIWEIMWYAGTTDSGSIAFDSGVGTSGGNTGLFAAASMFLNYNWNSASTITNSVSYAKSVGRSPFYIYAGCNQQGGEPKSGDNYPILKNYQYSIGMWGAHNVNMLWQSRNAKGSAPATMQRTYINDTEQWYTGGKRNPAIRQAIQTNRAHRPMGSWAGISSMKSARSTITHKTADEPFYTFFNLGNGAFFNWKGERLNNNPWYNIGVQDFLPTWRWWFTPTMLDGNISESDVHLAADFIWDDAYVGGSCLQISGTTTDEYLHLFKTKIIPASGNFIDSRFKILEGSADVDLILSNGTAPGTPVKTISLLSKDKCADAIDKSYDEGWQLVSEKLSGTEYSKFRESSGGIGLITLRIRNAENLKLYLGELSIYNPSKDYGTPSAPVVKMSKVITNSYSGVDGKIVWSMTNSKAAGEPVYNSDVNTSMFKVYAREEGKEPVFLGVTTSWAAIAFRGPNTDPSLKIQYGVSAVSTDTKSESAISWGALLEKGNYTASNEIELSKTTIKPGEAFTVRYVDSNHAASAWTVTDASGNTVGTANGTEISFPNGLEDVGGYDVYLDKGTTNERRFGYYIQISSEGVGALPEIYTTSLNGTAVDETSSVADISMADPTEFSYTGRPADGSASRALALNSRMIGAKVSELGLSAQKSLSIAGWFKFDDLPDDEWAFMNISNKGGAWPQNTWGWCWNYVDADGYIHCIFRGNGSDGGRPGELHYEFPDTKLQGNIWTHIAFVCEYNSAGSAFRLLLYINGVKQQSEWFQYASGNSGTKKYDGKTTDDWCEGQTYGIQTTDYVYFGGPQYQHSAVEGLVDDFQIWNKAMTEDDIRLSMSGIDSSNLPSNVVALWAFEEDAASDNSFSSIGSKAGAKAYSHDWTGDPQNGASAFTTYEPVFYPGCPFLAGTAYPVVTTAEWKDSDRKTVFTKAASRAAAEDEAGSATATFVNKGDHQVALTLQNNYGSTTKQFPVFHVYDPDGAIEGVEADGSEAQVYTVDNVLFVEFGADGLYNVEVYNASGMQIAGKNLQAVAGQNARITLGAAGVYVVRVSRDGQELRTLKVMSK